MSIRKKVLKSARWSISESYFNLIVSFGGNIILARLLLPEDFGTYTLSFTMVGLIFMVAGFGSQEAIIQCRDDTIEDLIPTAFWMTVVLVALLTLISIITGFALSFFLDGIIFSLVVCISFAFFFNNIQFAYISTLKRELRYQPISLISIFATFVSFSLAGLLAWNGIGIWALLVRDASWSICMLIGSIKFSGYKMPFRANAKAARWVWDFGWHLMISRIAETLSERLDKVIVGAVMGAATLGQYSLACRLQILPYQVTSSSLQSVMLSTFSAVQYEKDKLDYAFERAYYWLYRIIVAMGLVVLIAGKDLVTLVYTSKWQDTGSILSNMFLATMLLPLSEINITLLIGQGKVSKLSKARIFQLFFLIPVVIGAFSQNLVILAWAVNLNTFLFWLLLVWFSSKGISVRWSYLLLNPAIAAAVTAILLVITFQFYTGLDLILIILIKVAAAISIYSLILFLAEHKVIFTEIHSIGSVKVKS